MGGKAIGNDPFAASYDLPLLSVVENYTRYYAEGRSHTARAKRVDLREFLQFLVLHRGAAGPEKLTVKDWDTSAVHGFVEHCLRRGQAPATVARRLATLKHMGRTLAERSPGFINPARDVRPPRLADTKPRALTAQELHDVTQRAHARFLAKQTFIRRRNEVLFHLLLDTGMRADEIRMLKRQQLQHELDWIASVRTKGRRYRNVYVSAVMRPLLRDYLEARTFELKRFFPRLTKSQDEALPLFISTYRAQPQHPETFSMGAKSVWRAVHEIAAELRLHPHLLRHSYATHLLDHAKDIRLVSQALGHSDVRVTMRYTERRDEEVARAVESMQRQKK